MRATVMYGQGDVRVETVPDAHLIEPTDALVSVTCAGICGSDLWPYRTMEHNDTGRRMGHEFIGVVDAVGADVRTVEPGDLVVSPFLWSDGTCVFCREGLHTSCLHGGRYGFDDVDGGRGEAVRVPPGGRHARRVAGRRGRRAAAVPAHAVRRDGDGSPRGPRRRGRPGQGSGRCRGRRRRPVWRDRRPSPRCRADHHPRPSPRPDRAGKGVRCDGCRTRARRRGDRARPRAHRRLRRPLGTRVRRPAGVDPHRSRHRPAGGAVGRVGLPQDDSVPEAIATFFNNVAVGGGPAPARAYIEELLPDVLEGRIEPGRVFDRAIRLEEVPEGYRAMDDRDAVKVLIEL